MWLTGFDAPSCSTVYLDKPMRNHTLMQTIARANRVFPGKHSGVIVDYANVFASLEKALAIYGAGKDGKSPVKDKQQLVEELRKAVVDATAFCAAHGVMLGEIEATPAGSMERLSRIQDGMNALISPDPLRRDFFAHERLVSTLYRAVKPDPAALEFASRVACLTTLGRGHPRQAEPEPAGHLAGDGADQRPARRIDHRPRNPRIRPRRRSTCRRSTSRRWRSASRSRSTRTPTSKCSRPRSAPSWKR
jgi:type I restriction enzyme R subunit